MRIPSGMGRIGISLGAGGFGENSLGRGQEWSEFFQEQAGLGLKNICAHLSLNLFIFNIC